MRKGFSHLKPPNTVRCLSYFHHELNLAKHNISSNATTDEVPSSARVVVAGAGIIGSAVAYQLAKQGWTDVVLLDQGRVASGSTHHSVGLLGLEKQSKVETVIVQNTIKIYEDLKAEGYDIDLRRCGGVNLATTDDRMIVFKRFADVAATLGIEASVIPPRDLADLHPVFTQGSVRIDDVRGGLWIADDHAVDSSLVAKALAKSAESRGVRIVERCRVEAINAVVGHNSRAKVESVHTDKGSISCEFFVNCAGFWARDLGFKSTPTVKVPLQSCQHYYLDTTAF